MLRASTSGRPAAAGAAAAAAAPRVRRAPATAGAAAAASAWAAAAAIAAVLVTASPGPALAADAAGIEACAPGASCVSTSSFMQPAQYLPPWILAPADTPADAFRALLTALRDEGATVEEADEAAGFIRATLGYELPGGGGKRDDIDDLTFLIRDGVILYRSQSRLDLPSPPFCFTKGCISGPRSRGRMEALRDRLGLTGFESDEGKSWVPILLH
jgi:hypothetical protein